MSVSRAFRRVGIVGRSADTGFFGSARAPPAFCTSVSGEHSVCKALVDTWVE